MAEESFEKKYTVTTRYLTKPSKRRPGLFISPGVKFIVAHDTGNPASTAGANVRYYENSRDENSASAHIFVDDKEIIECIPALEGTPEKAWHVIYNTPTDNQLYGFDANDAAIGIEYCFGGRINADEAYRKFVWAIAYACHKYGLNPKTSVVGHCFLDPKRKTDPVTGLLQSRRTYEQLLRNVVEEYSICCQTTSPNENIDSQFVANSGTTRATVKLNIRKSSPSTMSSIVQTVPVGTSLNYTGWTLNGEPINGNPKWYQDSNGNYFWSGGTV